MSSIYDSLNPVQQEAVYHTEGPLLILAGAGSGKTRVLTHRIAYLIGECHVNPWNIFAITFTNKAAREMRERVDQIVGSGAEDVWVSTFHSACVRILRRHIDRLGLDRNFTIYDTDDQKTVVRQICKNLNIDTKKLKERTFLSYISSAKNEMVGPVQYAALAKGDFLKETTAKVYEGYEQRMRENNALDFDDLLCYTVELFQKDSDVLGYYQERLKYIMVDEYQDTNTVQFMMISLLAQKYHNICVVGDDDQSIYKFRGANINNILNFEKTFPGAKVIKLEQNYRSTKTILEAANSVIHHNIGRKDKTLWTSNEEGAKITLRQYNNEYDEANGVVRDIERRKDRQGLDYRDFAVLYRTNAQARVLEEKFVTANIPYHVFGGVNFYQRREIKDILSYLRVVDNGSDDISVQRIINVPRRGIGSTTLGKAVSFAASGGISLFEGLCRVDDIEGMGRAAGKIRAFTDMILGFRAQKDQIPLADLYDNILDVTGYLAELKAEQTDEAQTRIENLDELRNKIVAYTKEHEDGTLSGLLEEIALVAEVDNLEDSDNQVVLMTLHSAKGLEFPYVYMTGMEEGLFPSYMSMMSGDPSDVEEERRLCYVGITRAMKHLTLSYARSRMIHGNTQYNSISRFIREIPPQFLDARMDVKKPAGRTIPQSAGSGFYTYSESAGAAAGRGGDLFGSSRSSGAGCGSKAASAVQSYIRKGSSFTKIRPDYGPGDRVKHRKFGIGIVKEVTDQGSDYEVAVEFEKFGMKKMKASFAKLVKA